MVPWRRQKGDIDAEADDGEVAVQQPADHLESLRRPRPSVHPGRLGGDQLVSAAAATHGRRASQPLTEAVHLGSTRRGEQMPSEEKTSSNIRPHITQTTHKCLAECGQHLLGK